MAAAAAVCSNVRTEIRTVVGYGLTTTKKKKI